MGIIKYLISISKERLGITTNQEKILEQEKAIARLEQNNTKKEATIKELEAHIDDLNKKLLSKREFEEKLLRNVSNGGSVLGYVFCSPTLQEIKDNYKNTLSSEFKIYATSDTEKGNMLLKVDAQLTTLVEPFLALLNDANYTKKEQWLAVFINVIDDIGDEYRGMGYSKLAVIAAERVARYTNTSLIVGELGFKDKGEDHKAKLIKFYTSLGYTVDFETERFIKKLR